MENITHFLDQLAARNLLLDKLWFSSSSNNSVGFAKLLDHAILYTYVLNQTERALFYRKSMLDHMAQMKDCQVYRPLFDDIPRDEQEKEMLWQVLERPKLSEIQNRGVEDSDNKAKQLKEEGDRYYREKMYSEALDAYSQALASQPSKSVRQAILINRCLALKKQGNIGQCISACMEAILEEFPQSYKAFIVLALCYRRLVRASNKNKNNETQALTAEGYKELYYVWGAMAKHLASKHHHHDEGAGALLKRNGFHLERTHIMEADSLQSLENAIVVGMIERNKRFLSSGRVGRRIIVLLKQGVYELSWQTLTSMSRCVILGDFQLQASQKPTIRLDAHGNTRMQHFSILDKNLFINVHFDTKDGQLVVESPSPVMFVQCSFQSSALSSLPKAEAKLLDEMAKEKEVEFQLRMLRKRRQQTTEDIEKSPMAPEDLDLHTMIKQAQRIVRNGKPAITVAFGQCILVNCQIVSSLAGGVLADNQVYNHDNEPDKQPLLLLKNCIIENCSLAGVELRKNGHAILENCVIRNCRTGIMSWFKAKRLKLERCEILNSMVEGIHIIDTAFNYVNDLRIEADSCSFHHNLLGLSLECVNVVKLTGNTIFANKTWGVHLRNAYVATLQGNNISRNANGGVRVSCNRYDGTILTDNLIHDHTGPGLVQTHMINECENELTPVGFGMSREANSCRIITMGNKLYNNDLTFASIKDLRIPAEPTCRFCNKTGSDSHNLKKCPMCQKVFYCNEKCRTDDANGHAPFCDYFTERHSLIVTLEPTILIPANKLIEDRTAPRKLKDYYDKEFLVKVTCGTDDIAAQMKNPESAERPFLYDECRFISGNIAPGMAKEKLILIVRQFGKLCGEQFNSKHVYVYAKLYQKSKNSLIVRTDNLVHNQAW